MLGAHLVVQDPDLMDRISVIAELIACWLCSRDASHSSAVDGTPLFPPSACIREENERAGDKEGWLPWVANNAPEAKTVWRIIVASEKIERFSYSNSGWDLEPKAP